MRPAVKRIYLAITPLLLKERRLLRRIAAGNRLVVLNFHQVRPSDDPYSGPIHPDIFDELLGFIRRTFSVRTFGELEHAGPSDRPVAVLSFDDGFRSFIDFAMPLLARHGLRANQNVIPAAILGFRPFTVALADLLAASPASLLCTLRLPGFDQQLRTDRPEHRAMFAFRLSNYFKLRPRAQRGPLWEELQHHLREVEVTHPTAMMDLAAVREAALIHEIGVHSFEHETMAFEPMDYFQSDFDRCRRFFSDTLQLPLRVYAFPNGLARREQVDWLQGRGIRDALLVGDAFSHFGSHVHNRFNVAAPTLRELRLQVLGLRAGPLL